MTATRRTDIVVIGAGTAGLSAVDEIERAGRTVLVVDRGPLGTTCVRVGCIPSKAVLHAGRRWTTANALADWSDAQGADVRQRLWTDARALRDRLSQGQADKTRERLGDRLVLGEARFVAANAIEVDGVRIEARAFVVATGSRPVVPKEIAALGDDVLTTDTLFDLDTLPRSMGVVGLGNVGIELGLALARLGARVVAVDEKRWPGGIADPHIGDRAVRSFGKEMTLRLGAKADIARQGDAFRMRIGDETQVVDGLLAALGRRPNLEALDLAAAGVTWPHDDAAPVDGVTLRLAGTAIFVAGDASAQRPLLHEAIDEGVIAARGALAMGFDVAPADLPPRKTPLDIVFTDPDVIRVGAAFDTLDPAHLLIGTGEGSSNGRSILCESPDNLVRIYADRSGGRLLGASAISLAGENLAHLLALAIDRGLTADELLRSPFYHPTFEELVQNALNDLCAQLRG